MRRSIVARFTAALAVATLVLLAAGCGSSSPTSTPTQGATATPTTSTSSGDATPTATKSAASPTPTSTTPPSFDPEAYFKGKTIRLVSISPPGGGTDAQARVIAALLPKFIPGNPRISVSDIARVGGYNYMYAAKGDGYTIQYMASPGYERQLAPDAKFKLKDFPIIAAVGISPPVWVATKDVPYDSLDQAIGKTDFTFRFAEAVGQPIDLTGNPLTTSILCDRLNLQCEGLPVAEAGTDSQLLMMDRGETNGNLRGSLWWNLATLRPGSVAAGDYKGLVAAGNPSITVPPHPETDWIPPQAYDMLPTEQDKDDFALVSYPAALFNKALAGAPNTPDHIVAVWVQAFKDALADDEFAKTLSDVTAFDVRNDTVFHDEIQPIYNDTYDRFFGNQEHYAELQNDLYAKYWER